MTQFCQRSGKLMFRSRAPAERALARLKRASHSGQGSIYLCHHCHHYHLTHWDYENQDLMDRLQAAGEERRLSKKLMRSLRNRAKPKKRIPEPRYDIYKTHLPMDERTIEKWNSPKMREARLKLDCCYLMADVMNSFFMDAYDQMKNMGICFQRDEKKKFNDLVNEIARCKTLSRIATMTMYDIEQVDEVCQESDLFADLLWTIIQRLDDENGTERLELSYKMMKAHIVDKFPNLFIEHKKTTHGQPTASDTE